VASTGRNPHRAENGVSAHSSSGLCEASRYRRSGASSGIPAADSSANPTAARSDDGWAWSERGSAAAEGPLRVGGDDLVEPQPAGPSRGQGMGTEPELGLRIPVGLDPQQLGDGGR